jgi:hypothetical protein
MRKRMVIATLQLKSARSSSRDKVYGAVGIANVGGDERRGEYEVTLMTGPQQKERKAVVKDFPRKSASAWELLRRALNELKASNQLP